MSEIDPQNSLVQKLQSQLQEAQNTIVKLQDKVKMFQRVINHLPHFYTFWKDLDCRFLGGDKQFYQKGGYQSQKDMIGKTDYDSAWKKEADGFRNIDLMVINQDLPAYTVIEKQTQADGKIVWLSTTKSAMHDEQGKLIGLVGVSDDVTEKLKKEKLLRESEHRFRLLSEVSSEGVAIHKNGEISDTNLFLAEMFNYDAKELIGMHLRELLSPAYHDLLHQFLESNSTQSFRAIGRKHSPSTLPKTIVTFNVEITFRNDPIQAVSIHDISEQIKVEKIKNDFLANTSHELRTPLNGIIGIAESLMEGVAGSLSEKVNTNLLMIISSGRRLYNLVNDILDYSKMRHESLKLQKTSVDLRNITDIIMALTRPLIIEKPVQLINLIQKTLPAVWADEDRLQQILYNLIGNAIKFTAQGEITVTAIEEADEIKIMVSDTGIGIPNSRQKAIFESFQQADSSTNREFGGTGLGLTISRQLVQAHGSDLQIISTPSKGSVFYFYLKKSEKNVVNPLYSSKLPTLSSVDSSKPFQKDTFAIDSVPKSLKPQGNGQLILVVDDEPVNLQMIKNFLQLHQYQVQSAQSGYQALDILKTTKPDLVILDIMMPRMDGYELCGIIRQSFDTLQLPIIFLTAKNQVSDLVRGLSSGANDFLTKPFYQEELLIRVKTHLSLKESFDTLQENQQLKIEIRRRRQTELELDHSQKRLARILDISENALIAINENQEIVYFNQQAENIFEYQREILLNQSIENLLTPGFLENYQKIIDTIDHQVKDDLFFKANQILNIRTQKGSDVLLKTAITTFELDDERIYTFIINEASGTNFDSQINQLSKADGQLDQILPKGVLLELLKEQLNKTESIQFMEGIFDNIIRYLVKSGTDLIPQLRKNIDSDGQSRSVSFYQQDKFRTALVDLMTLSINCWKELTGKSKWQLAEESGLWKAYLDQGVYKTRTMNKYLKIDKLPQNPKWNRVIDTAEYVLQKTPDSHNQNTLLLKQNLSSLLEMVKNST